MKQPWENKKVGILKNEKCLILFTCYFKNEEKKFVYSTGEKINPKNWDFKNKWPFAKGSNRDVYYSSINTQLNRYENTFESVQARCKSFSEDFTSRLLKSEFDKEFKKAISGQGTFFNAYDEFMEENIKSQKWGKSSIKRYQNLRNLLSDFQITQNFKLTFNKINQKFHSEFTDYSIDKKGHATNTFRRNMGLFKTFMLWALKNGYTYNNKFSEFERMKEVFTKKLALRFEDLQKLMGMKFEKEKLERARDVFVFACTTGMRYGELKFIGKHNIENGYILLKEEKSLTKKSRQIPLNSLSKAILSKYDFLLPIIANQKQNEYLKEIFELAGYTELVEQIVIRGKNMDRKRIPMFRLISTHTARRTFITMMKRKGFSDKLISEITGHTDLKTLNQYYQVDAIDTEKAVAEVFDNIYNPLRKID
ncbi:MAG: tyrosine-type recombinase/integrase [Bacteroidota bacterium]